MLETLTVKFHEKNNFFFKILILQESNHNIYNNIVKELHKNNYETYFATSMEEMNQIIKEYNINLIISENNLLNLEMFNKLPIILLFFSNEYNNIENYIKYTNIVDYFFIPLDINFLITRINFILIPKITTNTFKKNLQTYLLEAKLLQENKLNQIVAANEFDIYSVRKLSQYILYFSYILNLTNNFFLNSSFINTINNIKNIINSQLYFFNGYITFNINKPIYPSKNSKESTYFFLFLFFLGELVKNINGNIQINLNFFQTHEVYYCEIEYDKNFHELFSIYNEMRLNRNHLHEYIKEFLWENWKKKINFSIKDNIYKIEIFLQKK